MYFWLGGPYVFLVVCIKSFGENPHPKWRASPLGFLALAVRLYFWLWRNGGSVCISGFGSSTSISGVGGPYVFFGFHVFPGRIF